MTLKEIYKDCTRKNRRPELHLYFTKDYIVSVNGNLKILKRNRVIKIEETKVSVKRR